MRIAYTCQTTGVRGGLERIMVEKAGAMSGLGHDVLLIVNNPPGTQSAYDVNPGVSVRNIALPLPGASAAGRLRYKIVQDLRIRRALRAFRPDIVVAAPTWLTLSIIFSPGKLVLESHSSRSHMFGDERHSLYKRLKVAAAERLAACVVTLTAAARSQWPAARRVESIPNFTDIRPCRPYDTDSRLFMAAGRICPTKGFDILVEAWRHVAHRHPGLGLDIYGDDTSGGRNLSALQAQIDKAGLTDTVVCRGACRDMHEAYAGHAAFVLSSRYEGFGLVLLEAMNCGVPCVSFDCPEGPAEIISDGHDGLLVPFAGMTDRRRAEALAEGICRMMEDRDMRTRMSAEAVKKASAFSRDSIMERWTDLFRKLTEK